MTGTKEKILNAALELFSDKGYEAVSVGELAAAVGIKAPSLYKHFESKQDIFDALVEYMTAQYEAQSFLALPDERDRESDFDAALELTPERIAENICRQVRLITGSPVVAKTRKLLVIEQFRNPEVRDLMEKYQYRDIYDYNKGLMEKLTAAGVLRDCGSDVLALQFMSPITLQIQRIDRNPDSEAEALGLIRKHVIQFFEFYGK